MTTKEPKPIFVDADVSVTIEIHDTAPDDVFTRVNTAEWIDAFYTMDRDEVIRHWTYNAIANGITDVSQLDGWANMPVGAVTMRVTGVATDSIVG